MLSLGGKQTGKNRGWINIQEDGSEASSGIDLKQVDQWEFAETSGEEVVYSVLVPKIEHHQQIIQAKEKELNLWKKMDVCEEVEDTGQPRISTSWVVTQKVLDEEVNFKARLVCRGYEEENHLRGDSPMRG